MEAFLPKVPLPILPKIDISRVPTMSFLEEFTKAVFEFRYNDQMYMIWQKAVAPDFNLCIAFSLTEKVDVETVIAGRKKRSLTSISTLGHVMGVVGDN